MSDSKKTFAPTPEFAANAVAKADLYTEAKADRLAFWEKQAKHLHWHKPFTEVLNWSHAPVARWFDDGELNVSYNCLDRHVNEGRGDRVALYFEGEPGDRRALTYAELTREVKKAANVLTDLGVVKGDRVAIYMPMIPEAVITMLAAARLGAIHSVVFGGFSADALATRIRDADCRVVVTADGGYRKGKASALKPAVDEALANNACPTVEQVLVVKRTGEEVQWNEHDNWWHDL
ncbi:MAG: hypothetical protein RL683_185, partial [Actinomycetota bacterium]